MSLPRTVLTRTRQAFSVWLHGLPAAGAPPHGRMAVRNRFADLRQRIAADSPVIVDGGASVGRMIELFLSEYSSPTIHAFEPIPEIAAQLQTQFGSRPGVTVHQQALGAENRTVSFQILNRHSSSSVLKPSSTNVRYHSSEMDVSRVVEVPMVRLDSVLDQEIDILKLDLQGYELEALRGGERLLPQIKAITTEVEFVPLYEGQALFCDIDVFLRQHGFCLLNLYELWTHPDGQLTAGDAVYLNTRYF